ncbi:MAG: hypothetical protein ACHQAY_24815 [Hyphomicrobiales bacterium]
MSLEVATSVDGASIRQGEVLKIRWGATGAPEGSTVTLQLQKTVTGHVFSPIATGLPGAGTMSYRVPVFVTRPVMCAVDATGACVNDINPNTSYRIVATLAAAPAPGGTTFLARAMSGAFTMLSESPQAR